MLSTAGVVVEAKIFCTARTRAVHDNLLRDMVHPPADSLSRVLRRPPRCAIFCAQGSSTSLATDDLLRWQLRFVYPASMYRAPADRSILPTYRQQSRNSTPRCRRRSAWQTLPNNEKLKMQRLRWVRRTSGEPKLPARDFFENPQLHQERARRRVRNKPRPASPLPNNHTAAGIGTTLTCAFW